MKPKRINPFRNPMGAEMSILKWTKAMAPYYREQEDDGEPEELCFDHD